MGPKTEMKSRTKSAGKENTKMQLPDEKTPVCDLRKAETGLYIATALSFPAHHQVSASNAQPGRPPIRPVLPSVLLHDSRFPFPVSRFPYRFPGCSRYRELMRKELSEAHVHVPVCTCRVLPGLAGSCARLSTKLLNNWETGNGKRQMGNGKWEAGNGKWESGSEQHLSPAAVRLCNLPVGPLNFAEPKKSVKIWQID